jgi:hypothetical protein
VFSPAGASADIASTAQAPGPVRVNVSNEWIGPGVPADFVAIANEYWDIEKEVGTNPADPDVPFEQTVRNLSPVGTVNLRIGGDSTDWVWWPVAGMKKPVWVHWTITPRWIVVTKKLVDDLHAHLILGINMEADSPQIASQEVRHLEAGFGKSSIQAFELGNEPELYSKFPFYHRSNGAAVTGRPATYTTSDIAADWAALASKLGNVPLAGPGFTEPSAVIPISAFLQNAQRLSLLTVHSYPLKSLRCDGGVPLHESQLFEPTSLQDMAEQLGTWNTVAGTHRISLRVDEMNSVTCGGLYGFSNTFGPALWALNILPLYAATGLAGVNFNTAPGTSQNLIQTNRDASEWRVRVQPEYYGLLAFAQLAPPGSRLLKVSDMPAGIYAWADVTTEHERHVVITNVTTAPRQVVIRAFEAHGAATVTTLAATSGGLEATHGVTLGGQTISRSTGLLSGTPTARSLKVVNGTYTLTIPAASAAIITLG